MLKKLLLTTSLKANIVANFSGNGFMAVINLLFIPVYLKYIGSEGYGLIGVFASIQSILYILDSGLSTTLNKELAGLSSGVSNKQRIVNLVKTLETVYWPVAILVGIIALAASWFLATSWVQAKGLSEETVLHAFFILSITLVFQFPVGFYAGGLLGLQRHLLYNAVRVLFAIVKNIGAVLLLMYYSNSVIVFFTWNFIITVLTVLCYRFLLRGLIAGDSFKAKFDLGELKRVAKFSGGMAAISLSAILMLQADKVVLSKTILLADFGYYTIAVTLGMAVLQIVNPVAQSFFPKFSYLAALNKQDQLKETYHSCCQLVSIIIFPASLVIIFFTKEVLLLWTHNATTVENTWYVARLFSIGTAINAVASILFSFTFALNWTKFAVYISIYYAIIITPSIAIITWLYGTTGAGYCWIVFNVINLVFVPYVIHKKFLKGDLFPWFWNDTFKPFISCLIFILLIHTLIPISQFTPTEIFIFLILTGIMSVVISTIFSGKIKRDLIKLLTKK
ncbi:oligosaccharide flippase family protein [Ferruginibacter paludis]|uniref:lipopolysaccharide biosynthesis protein n=1 Tax=Ferruginibacter paludis TaxID=1310417 RepID=UPI0025B625F7|nr:oligosaccharide flippase family protein [Ferruginibacter paludis]MDN3658335.1 oligosaccharide flippase family protein [Ferruginibacter paludis]